MLLLQKRKVQGINTVIDIPLLIFLMSVTHLFFLCLLLNSFRNLVIFCMNVDIDKLLLLLFYLSVLLNNLLDFGDLDFIFKVTPAL